MLKKKKNKNKLTLVSKPQVKPVRGGRYVSVLFPEGRILGNELTLVYEGVFMWKLNEGQKKVRARARSLVNVLSLITLKMIISLRTPPLILLGI